MQGPEVGVGLIRSGDSKETSVARRFMLETERVREIKGQGQAMRKLVGHRRADSYCDHRDKRG